MDSVTLLYDYRDVVALAVTFDYGSNHNAREIACARIHCRRLQADAGAAAGNQNKIIK